MHKKTRMVAAVLFVVFITAGCGSEQPAALSPPGNMNAGRDLNVFRANLSSNPLTIDPAQAVTESELALVRALYGALVEYEGGSLKPSLAESWHYSEDGRQLFVKLRKGLKFSNGKPITALDVEFSLERIANPALASPYASLLAAEIGEQNSVMEAVAVSGTDTLVISFSLPRKDFTELLAHPCFSIVNKECMEKDNYGVGFDVSKATTVVASGPFSIIEWVKNKSISLEANKNYYDPVELDRLELLVQDDIGTTMYDFGTEYLDMVFLRTPDIKRVTTEYPDIAGKLAAGPSFSVYFLAINPQVPFFDTIQTRQAFLAALEASELVDASEIFVPAEHPMKKPSESRGGFYTNDPKNLLRNAGYGGDKKLPELVLSYPSGKISYFVAEGIQRQIDRTLGLKVDLKEIPPQRSRLVDSGTQMSLICWNIPFPGKSAFFPFFFTGGGSPFTYSQRVGEAGKLYFDETGKIEKPSQRDYYYGLISDAISQELVLLPLVEVKNVYVLQEDKDLDSTLLNIFGLSGKQKAADTN